MPHAMCSRVQRLESQHIHNSSEFFTRLNAAVALTPFVRREPHRRSRGAVLPGAVRSTAGFFRDSRQTAAEIDIQPGESP